MGFELMEKQRPKVFRIPLGAQVGWQEVRGGLAYFIPPSPWACPFPLYTYAARIRCVRTKKTSQQKTIIYVQYPLNLGANRPAG